VFTSIICRGVNVYNGVIITRIYKLQPRFIGSPLSGTAGATYPSSSKCGDDGDGERWQFLFPLAKNILYLKTPNLSRPNSTTTTIPTTMAKDIQSKKRKGMLYTPL
jgi:hypothetical protein